MAKPKGTSSGKGPVRDAKIKAAVEMQLRGVPTDIVASSMNVNKKTIAFWNKEAAKNGMLEQVREAMMEKLLPKVAETYDQILSTPAIELEEAPKGHEIRRKAAADLAGGLGVFRKETETKQLKATMDMESYLKYREMRQAAKLQDIELAKAVVEAAEAEPEVIDGDPSGS